MSINPSATFSFANRNLPGVSFQSNMGSKTLSECQVIIDKVVKDLQGKAPTGITLSTVAVDQTRAGLYFSGVAVVATPASGAPSAWVLVLASTNTPLAPKTLNWNGVNYQPPVGPEDIYDQAFATNAQSDISASLRVPVTLIGQSIISADFNFNDGASIFNIVAAATTALVGAVMDPDNTGPQLDLSKFTKEDALLVTLTSGADTQLDTSGNPLWSTFRVETVAGASDQQNRSPNNRGAFPVVALSGYVDMLYNQQVQPGEYPGQPPRKTYFTPRIVVTPTSAIGMDLPQMLLSIVQATAIGNNNQWMTQFLTRDPLMNAGLLNIEASDQGPQEPLDTTAANFDELKLRQFLATVCSPGYAITLRVGRSTPFDSALRQFVDASKGNAQAAQQILAAANTLTGGAFNREYKGGEPVMITGSQANGSADVNIRGTFVNAQGVTCDLAQLNNYLAFMASSRGREGAGKAYTQCRNDMTTDPAMRLHNLLTLCKNVMASTPITVTGVDRYVNFSGEFLRALAAAVQASGMDLRVQAQNPFLASADRASALNGMASAMLATNAGLAPMSRPAAVRGMQAW